MHESKLINYNFLITRSDSVFEYCFSNSECFSLITSQRKPYSKFPPTCIHEDYLSGLSGFLTNQIVGIKQWPGTLTKDNHKVLNMYYCCAEAKQYILEHESPFILSRQVPEDICFYRNGKPWFVTITHEKIAFLEQAVKKDNEFFGDFILSK